MKSSNAFMQNTLAEFTVLEMQRVTSTVQRIAGGKMQLLKDLPLSVDALVRQSLRHEPPLPIELEHAIELTEDAVMPLAAQFAGGSGLTLQGLGASLIVNALETSGVMQAVLTLDEVEALFNRLIAVSQGRPTSQEKLPTDTLFFASLLILREFMHHLRFQEVNLLIAQE